MWARSTMPGRCLQAHACGACAVPSRTAQAPRLGPASATPHLQQQDQYRIVLRQHALAHHQAQWPARLHPQAQPPQLLHAGLHARGRGWRAGGAARRRRQQLRRHAQHPGLAARHESILQRCIQLKL